MATLPTERVDLPAPTPKKINLVWATEFNGRQPARDWLAKLDEGQRKRVSNAITYVEQVGEYATSERLVSLSGRFGPLGKGLWVIKADNLRIIGTFRGKATFLALWGLDKKYDDYSRSDLESARRVMREYDIQARGSLDYLKKRVPKPKKEFKPTIVVPITARPELEPVTKPIELFRRVEQEHVWAWVDKRDLLPPHAPLLGSLCRLPTYHYLLLHEELPAYLLERVRAMPMSARLALGLVGEEMGQLMLGAHLAVELLTARELVLEDAKVHEAPPVVEVPVPVAAAAAPEPAPAEPEPELELQNFYWVRYGRKCFLVEVLGPAVTRTSFKSGIKAEKVKTRMYIPKPKKWTDVKAKPAKLFKDKASLTDLRVIEAMKHRPAV